MEITKQQIKKWSQSMPNTFLIGFTNENITQNNNNNNNNIKIWSKKENHSLQLYGLVKTYVITRR